MRKHFQGVDAIQACVETQLPGVPTATPAAGGSCGDYELLELLGRGGMGVVYKARQKSLGRLVALKMLRSYREENHDDVQRFFGEAEAAARLQHPHIVRIYEVGEDHGHPFCSMDFVEGMSLAAAISQNPLPQRRAAEYLQKIAEAMQFAHDQAWSTVT